MLILTCQLASCMLCMLCMLLGLISHAIIDKNLWFSIHLCVWQLPNDCSSHVQLLVCRHRKQGKGFVLPPSLVIIPQEYNVCNRNCVLITQSAPYSEQLPTPPQCTCTQLSIKQSDPDKQMTTIHRLALFLFGKLHAKLLTTQYMQLVCKQSKTMDTYTVLQLMHNVINNLMQSICM